MKNEYQYILNVSKFCYFRTTHSFIFGAMAELVDNARDASATSLEIYTGEFILFELTHKICVSGMILIWL